MLTEAAPSEQTVTEPDADIAPPPSRLRAVFIGAGAGVAITLVLSLILGGRFALPSAVATPRSELDVRATIEFVASSGGLYLVTLVAGALVGLCVAGLSYAVGREANSEAERYPLRAMLPLAAILSALVGYAMVRLGLGLWADITAGVVTISVSRMLLILVVAGAVTGALTGDAVDRLARPQLLGLEGVAVPESTGAMMREMMSAVGTPVVAFLVAAIFAIALSQLLLELAHTSVNLAVAVFSIAAALILAGAALLAYRPWERRGRSSGEDGEDE